MILLHFSHSDLVYFRCVHASRKKECSKSKLKIKFGEGHGESRRMLFYTKLFIIIGWKRIASHTQNLFAKKKTFHSLAFVQINIRNMSTVLNNIVHIIIQSLHEPKIKINK